MIRYFAAPLLMTLSSCGLWSTPEEVIRKYTSLLANGQCTEAMKLTTGNASEDVQGAIDAGCEPYELQIKSLDCFPENDQVKCVCIFGDDTTNQTTYHYYLKKTDDQWKIVNFNWILDPFPPLHWF